MAQTKAKISHYKLLLYILTRQYHKITIQKFDQLILNMLMYTKQKYEKTSNINILPTINQVQICISYYATNTNALHLV